MLKRFIYILILLAGIIAGFCVYFQYFYPKNKIEHYSYFSQKDFYEEAYNNAKPAGVSSKAIIVNHHLLASNFIAEGFNYLATTAPVTVLLVSPNHFSAGKFEVATSKAKWLTPYGNLVPDNKLINKLIKAKLVGVDEEPFLQEHGVSGLVGFIKKSLPNAKVVPIIFKDQISLNKVLDLVEKTFETLPKNVVVIGSFDFSHYLPKNASNFHDFASLSALENLDFDEIYKLDIDSKPGLAFYLRLVQRMGLNNFNLLEHSNSAELTKKDLLESTSYITGYFSSEESIKEHYNTLLTLGVLEDLSSITKFSLEYLQRFFYGQNHTLTFLNSKNENIESNLFNKGINILNNKIFETNLNNYLVKIIDCNNTQTAISYKEQAKVVICQNSNVNKVVQNSKTLYIFEKGKFLNKSGNFISFGLVSSKNSLKIFFFPISFSNGQFKLLVGQESDKVLIDMANNSIVKKGLKDQIKNGVVEINN